MNTLKELFLHELADMYDAEHRIVKALPRFIKAATSRELQNTLEQHLQETQDQAERVERIFGAFDEKARSRKCPAIAGILEEGEKMVSENKKSPAINAAIIAAVQKVEHYEIASYGCLNAWARLLDNPDAASLLEGILDEEKEANQALNALAVSRNQEALEEAPAGGGAR